MLGYRLLIHFGCAVPLAWVLFSGDETALGADPAKELIHFLGYTAIIIFCLMFLLGIFLQWQKRPQYQILRRPLGLWAFFWAGLHVAAYLSLELVGDIFLFLLEILSRPYLLLGAIAFSILAMMAITSLPALKRKLGKQWASLHQWGYAALGLAAVHYYWSVKSLTAAPILIVGVVGVILAWRLARKS